MIDWIRRETVVRVLWCAALTVVMVATLIPSPLDVGDVAQADKVQHLVAYFGLGLLGGCGWPERRLAIFVGLIGLGLGLEAMQGAMSFGRVFDWFDMAFNGIGVVLGLIASVPARRLVRIDP